MVNGIEMMNLDIVKAKDMGNELGGRVLALAKETSEKTNVDIERVVKGAYIVQVLSNPNETLAYLRKIISSQREVAEEMVGIDYLTESYG